MAQIPKPLLPVRCVRAQSPYLNAWRLARNRVVHKPIQFDIFKFRLYIFYALYTKTLAPSALCQSPISLPERLARNRVVHKPIQFNIFEFWLYTFFALYTFLPAGLRLAGLDWGWPIRMERLTEAWGTEVGPAGLRLALGMIWFFWPQKFTFWPQPIFYLLFLNEGDRIRKTRPCKLHTRF